jgi:hypothetical protein
LRCEFAVTITCSCGRITATVPCGAGGASMGDNMFEVSIIQKLPMPLQPVESNGRRVPLGQRKLFFAMRSVQRWRRRGSLLEHLTSIHPIWMHYILVGC